MIRPVRTPLHTLRPERALRALSGMPGLCFLDSARIDDPQSRYSFLMADPFEVMIYPAMPAAQKEGQVEADPWTAIRDRLALYQIVPDPDEPPFRGGAAGYFSYELARTLEELPAPKADSWAMPRMYLPFYDVVIVFDHVEGEAWMYSSGFPETEERCRTERAQRRVDEFLALLSQSDGDWPLVQASIERSDWLSNFSEEEYQAAVEKVRQYIAAGDIFQANISQRFSATLPEDFEALTFYLQLRRVNAAPFAAFIVWGEGCIASASPERFVRLQDGEAETRPIKGTRPRHPDPNEDALQIEALLRSRKDHAENTMIVDLLRNDFSRVCVPGSVKVPVLCGLETYAGVHHLVSEVRGKLEPGRDMVDLLKACFPGGSVTGAPKKRSMEIIHELEPVPRQLYCGAIGYLGFDGNMDSSIPIRTVMLRPGRACFQTGGGITWLSEPLEEYQETLDKAALVFSAFGS